MRGIDPKRKRRFPFLISCTEFPSKKEATMLGTHLPSCPGQRLSTSSAGLLVHLLRPKYRYFLCIGMTEDLSLLYAASW